MLASFWFAGPISITFTYQRESSLSKRVFLHFLGFSLHLSGRIRLRVLATIGECKTKGLGDVDAIVLGWLSLFT